MYLQSLELIGFKSFAQKTVLTFHPGVTAIVGPNGCGKSNLLDAVRWVLGEQSPKALRGGEMSDVIFSGTDKKQAVGMAEVSLTFDECEKDLGTEFNQVRISRRVFRDGRSEYLLNKTPCRLRDIQMLLMDTGIGRTAYSIMEQGKIDLVLSSRPEDRRAIFEDAAGITRYKAQKKEALRKLEYTDANLVRLADILKEVKRQIGSLQRQAGKARRYKSLLNDLQILDTHFSRKAHEDIQLAVTEAEKEVGRLRDIQRSLEEQVESQEFGRGKQRERIDQLEDQVTSARQRVQELKSQIDSASNRIAFNEERVGESGTLLEQYQADVATAEQKLLAQQSQLEETDELLNILFESLSTEEEQLQEQQKQGIQLRSRRQDVERSTQDLLRQIQQRESRIAGLRGDLSSTLSQKEAGETRLELLQRELTQTVAIRRQIEDLVSHTENELELAKARVQGNRNELNDSEHELANIQNELHQIESDLSAKHRVLTDRESKLEVLKQLNEEGAGLGAGTQAVLKGLDNPQLYRPAVIGALANSIEVKNEHLAAVEAALGYYLHAVLVQEHLVGESIAIYLAEKKIGRAAIVSLAHLPDQSAVRAQSLPEGAIAWALDQIESKPEVRPLISRLLDNVVLAPNLTTAFVIKKNNPDLAVATTSGEYISHDGVVFAGFNAHNDNSILQRKIQIRELENDSLSIRCLVQNLESGKQQLLNRVGEYQRSLEEKRDAWQRMQVNTSTLQGQLSLLDRELREAEGKIKSLNWERDNVRQRLDAAADKVNWIEHQLADTSRDLDRLQTELATSISAVEALRRDEEALVDILNELKVRVATDRQREENLQRQRQTIAVRLTELKDLIIDRHRDIANYSARIEQFTNESAILRARIEQFHLDQAEAEAHVGRLQEDRAQQVKALEAIDLNLRHLRKQLSHCQEMRGEHAVKMTQWNLRLEHIQEHVTQRYHVDLSSLPVDWYAFQVCLREQRKRLERPEVETDALQPVPGPGPNAEIDWEFVQTAVSEMAERLDAMGPVNLEAIQEYDELEDRQKFLEDQHADLVKSKSELLAVINKINATTKELFADSFEQVRKNFQEMFAELFGGGKANLLLVDEQDPLESGIEIIARPPGKQLQSISLLSGGERTMTAVALLFAIYMVKPSPFCVLDEMDAPLDESNIRRFTKLLDRFVHQSQFIVITHNKRTIAKADVLYGVTMEEHGISKLVGVKLTQRENSTETADLIGTAQVTPSIAETFGKTGHLHSETER
ncbi:MAG: chromosome segregation protein SMC [Verrucomicrobia bacterium]|nr:chromosome segregation protein SMC [Verrucomicrobiota bacterium]